MALLGIVSVIFEGFIIGSICASCCDYFERISNKKCTKLLPELLLYER